MVIDIKMCRFESVPWGFRLVGGSDYDYPLTVVKVSEGSIAESAGLKVEDVIVRINDVAASPLSHEEANQVIKHCGNVFYFGVFRENVEVENVQPKFPVKIKEPDSVPLLKFSSEETSITSLPEVNEDFRNNQFIPELPDRPCSVLSETTEIKLVEEEIAAVLSGESEVLKEHNVMGLFPKPGVCMSSDVLRSLNEDAIKTQAEKVQEMRKWSTFLQKPNRPVPKSKQQLEAERRAANAYKVKIVKSVPRTEKEKSPMPKQEEIEIKPVAVEMNAASPKLPSPPKEPTPPSPSDEVTSSEQELPLQDSELPNLEEISQTSENDEEIDVPKEYDTNGTTLKERKDKEEEEDDVVPTNEPNTPKESDVLKEVNVIETSSEAPTQEKTEEELILERRLVDVQKQLAALSSLPSTIKSTLDAVTKQLAEILPTFKLEPVQLDVIDENVKLDTDCEKSDECSFDGEKIERKAADLKNEESKHVEEENFNQDQHNQDGDDSEVERISQNANEQIQQQEQELESQGQSDILEDKISKKAKKHDVIGELEKHFDRQSNRKRSKRAFGPLTPSSERPLVLPGGRRWYRPKDAYNDEFIAETLSAQAELITGTTLGCTFESSLLGYDSRVNFMKYQKPERKIDLDRSEVYKVIHHLDRKPVRGIEVRPPLVAAEDDIRKSIKS